MNILHIAYSLEDSSAATRIANAQVPEHNVFFALGRRSRTTFVRQRQEFPFLLNIIGVVNHLAEMILKRVFQLPLSEVFSFGLSTRAQVIIVNWIVKNRDVDVIHLHWGGYGYFPVRLLANINVPVVITAHDFYYFTGGCHVPMGCVKIGRGCSECPETPFSIARKYIKKQRLQNKKLFEIRPVVVTAPSSYAVEKIKGLYDSLRVEEVGNVVGLDYRDAPIEECVIAYESALKESDNIPTIITVSVADSQKHNKGLDVLTSALNFLNKKGIKYNYISVGRYYEAAVPGKRTHLDYVDSQMLTKLYASSDLCLVPSRYETFSQVTLESIVCGTPVVAFENSGPASIIINEKTGFLVKAFDIDLFAMTVYSSLNYKRANLSLMLSESESLRDKYSGERISSCYHEVYKEAIGSYSGAGTNAL